MHSKHVIHRDLKLENILIDRKTKQTKLIDFGFSKQVSSVRDRLTHVCGTHVYMSPELVQKREYIAGGVDIWALGVLLFILLTGK